VNEQQFQKSMRQKIVKYEYFYGPYSRVETSATVPGAAAAAAGAEFTTEIPFNDSIRSKFDARTL
jgi:hypothetical protein